MNILEIKQLSKAFGNKEVLSKLDMVVPEHSIFGFVGQNGAGKTTTMKIILGLLKADSGTITVCGETVTYGDTKTNRHIGYLPDVPEFYSYMNPMEYLQLCGQITGLSKAATVSKAHDLLKLVGLDGENRKIGAFSRGMKQRLGIAQALLNEPQLLICDEPTSALDPIGRKEILDILLTIKGKTTVVFSTHILSDVERVCDNLAILHQGKLALHGTLAELKKNYSSNAFMIEFSNEKELNNFLTSTHLKENGVTLVKDRNTITVTLQDQNKNGAFLIDVLAQNNLVPVKFEKLEPSLENLYAGVVQ